MENEMISCDDCGVMFADSYDLQRHVKRKCPESEDSPSPSKKQKMESESDVKASDTFVDFSNDAINAYQKEWQD